MLGALLVAFLPGIAAAQEIDWQKVDAAFGRKAAVVAGDVHRYTFPRTDLAVTLDGVAIKPALALGSWTAFKDIGGGHVMAMGDLVLLETEVTAVLSKLAEGGFEITAVHNHLLRASPETFYLHVLGHGDPVKLAGTIHDALATSKTPLTVAAAAPPPAVDLDTAQLDQIIGVKGTNNGGVYAFAVPRRDPVSEGGDGDGSGRPDGGCAGHQLSADRVRQGRHHGRLRAHRRGSQPGDQCAACKRHRGDGGS